MTRTPSARPSASPEPLGAPFSASAHLPSTTSRRRSAWRRWGRRRASSRLASTAGFTRSITSTVIRDVTRRLSERLDEDHLAGRDVATLLLEHDEAVARGHRGEDARALRPRGAYLPGAVPEGHNAALELAPTLLLVQRLGRARLVDVGKEAPSPAEFVDGGPDEEHEGEHRGDGVAGEAEEVGRPDPPERDRAAGLHRDLREFYRADLLEDVPDEVVHADGHASRGHDDVARRARVDEARAELVAYVGHDAEVHDLAAALLDRPAEREPVRVVNLAGRARPARLDHLVAGREQHDARSSMDRHLDLPERGDQPDLLWPQDGATLDDDRPRVDVLATHPHVRPLRDRSDPHSIAEA